MFKKHTEKHHGIDRTYEAHHLLPEGGANLNKINLDDLSKECDKMVSEVASIPKN